MSPKNIGQGKARYVAAALNDHIEELLMKERSCIPSASYWLALARLLRSKES
jgi:hypothetical protein